MGKKWDKFLATVKGAAHKTKKQVVKTVDVAQQKNAIARKKRSLSELYVEIGTMVCNACKDETLLMTENGLQSDVAFQTKLCDLIELEADFKDEIERMEKMLHWLQTHDVEAKTEVEEAATEEEAVSEEASGDVAETVEEPTEEPKDE